MQTNMQKSSIPHSIRNTMPLYANGKAVTNTYAYSIGSYAYAVQETAGNWPESLLNVTKLMMIYGDAATAYFENP